MPMGSFQRINSQGTAMDRVHMINALTWSAQFDLLKRIADVRAEVLAPLGWGEIEEEVVLKTTMMALGLDPYEKDPDKVSKLLKARPDAIEHAAKALAKAATFLKRKCGLGSLDLLPYTMQAILLADVFRRPELVRGEGQLRCLEDWFWLTSYGGLFAGISGGRLQRAVEYLREDLKRDSLRWPGTRAFSRAPLRPRIDARAARSKVLALWLARREPLEGAGSPVRHECPVGTRGPQRPRPALAP